MTPIETHLAAYREQSAVHKRGWQAICSSTEALQAVLMEPQIVDLANRALAETLEAFGLPVPDTPVRWTTPVAWEGDHPCREARLTLPRPEGETDGYWTTRMHYDFNRRIAAMMGSSEGFSIFIAER